MYPDRAEQLCRALAEKIRAEGFGDVSKVVSPAVGGIIPGYETARHLKLPSVLPILEDSRLVALAHDPTLPFKASQLEAPLHEVRCTFHPS